MAKSVDEESLREFKDLSLDCVMAVGGVLRVRSLTRVESGIHCGDAGSAAGSLKDYLSWITGIWRKWNAVYARDVVEYLRLTNCDSKAPVSLRGVTYSTAHEASVYLLEPLVNLPAELGFDSVLQLRDTATRSIRLCRRVFDAIGKAQIDKGKRLEAMIVAEWSNAVRAINGSPSDTEESGPA